MEESQANAAKKLQPICTLKVNIICCSNCRSKAKEKLQKINGVESVACDPVKGVLTISGKVNPMIIVRKIENWGKKAELLSLEQSTDQEEEFKADVNCTDDSNRETKSQSKNDCCCRCDSVSDSDSETEPEVRGLSRKNNSDNYNPNVALNNNNNDQSTKSTKSKKWFGLFRKMSGGAKVATAAKPSSMAGGASKWKFPSTPDLDHGGGPRPYHQPFQPYRPPMMGMPPSRPSYYPYGFMRPPRPPSYGVFNSKPPPKVNPMVHYTSYVDNYSPW